MPSSRRRFLRQAANAGVALSATSMLGKFAFGQTAPAHIYIDSRRQIAPLASTAWLHDPRARGSMGAPDSLSRVRP